MSTVPALMMLVGCSIAGQDAPPPGPASPSVSSDGASSRAATSPGAATSGRPTSSAPARGSLELTDFGARCDGHTNDRDALSRALLDAQRSRASISLPIGTCVIRSTGEGLSIPEGTRILGKGSGSVLRFHTDVDGFGVMLNLGQGQAVLSNLTLSRGSSGEMVLLRVGQRAEARLDGVTLRGSKAYSGNCHGIELVGSGTKVEGSLEIDGSRFEELDYGLFMNSTTTPTSATSRSPTQPSGETTPTTFSSTHLRARSAM